MSRRDRHLVSHSAHRIAAGQFRARGAPFENDGDTSNAYFADGITDEIRGKLTALPALHVIARASSNEYRRTEQAAAADRERARRGYLLTGVVRWETNPTHARRVRVSPELVQLSQGSAPRTIWQQTYDTTLADVFQVQSSVASKVAENLGVVLNAPAQTQIAQRPTQNLAAYEAYLRSTAIDGTDCLRCVAHWLNAEQAVALDSSFAAAWARVGRLHAIIYAMARSSDAEARGSAHRNDAVALDSGVYVSYVSRAIYWDIVGSDEERARATSNAHAFWRLPRSRYYERWDRWKRRSASGTKGWRTFARRRCSIRAPPPTADRLSRVLVWLRRYPEARAAADHGLVVSRRAISR